MQGFGVRVSPMQIGTPAFKAAIMEVLGDPRYTKAAQAMSVKIKARKNTPVQEAAGEQSTRNLNPYPICEVGQVCIYFHIYRDFWCTIGPPGVAL